MELKEETAEVLLQEMMHSFIRNLKNPNNLMGSRTSSKRVIKWYEDAIEWAEDEGNYFLRMYEVIFGISQIKMSKKIVRLSKSKIKELAI